MCRSCCWSFSLLGLFSGLGALHLPLAEAEIPNCDECTYLSPGKAIWTLDPHYLPNGTLAAPGVVLPDLDEDGVRDLAVLVIGELQVCSVLGGPCFLQGKCQLWSFPSIVIRNAA